MSEQQVDREAVLAALGTVIEPEQHKDLVSLNMIRDLEIEGGEVSFAIMLTTPACPLKGTMERDARSAVEQVPGVTAVQVDVPGKRVTVSWDSPANWDNIAALLTELEYPPAG